MKKKLSLLIVALVGIAAFAATMSLRDPGETIKTVDGTTTTWDLTAITADMGNTLSILWTKNDNYYQSNGAVSESPAFAGGITFIDTNGSGGKCRIYFAGDNPGQGFYFGGNAASMSVPVSAGQTLIVTTTGGGGVKSQTENVSFTITGTGPYVSTATIPEGVTEVKFARNAGSATYCTTIVTKTESKAPANLKVTSETALVLPLGNTSDISYTTDSKADVTFESSAPEVATVSSTGVIEAVASGASVITVSQAETDDYQAGVAQVSVAVPYVHTYAAEYTIGNATYGFSDANNNYYFTNGLTMSNSGKKNYGSGSLDGSMKYSANTEYTINIPEGVTITSATVTGRSNYASDANKAYWGNLFGEDLSTEALPYSNEDPATKTVEFAEGATGTLKFTPAGNQVQYIITLTANASPEPAENVTSTYIFTSANWTATKDGEDANWTSGKNGAGYSNNGVQVTTNATGANATSPDTYDNISKIVVTYNTNQSKGAGTLAVKIGDNEATTKNWAYSGSGDGKTANFTAEFDYATPQSGAVTLTANTTTNSIYVVSVAITHAKPAPPAVATPTFSPEGGEYTEVQTVTLACETVGATIFYALGSGEYTEYTQPLTISETTTISAYAQKDEDKSKVVSATYTIELPTATLAELNALSSGATFTFGGAALVVAKPNAKYVYIKDATASSLIYDANGTMTAAAETGKTITAPWSGKVSIYNKLFELVPDAALTVGEETTTITYPVKDLNYVVAENVNQVVKLEGVTYTLGEGKNLTINSGELTVAGYNQFGLTITAAEEGRTYNIVGAIGRHNDNIQFQPISIERVPAAKDIEIAAADITDGDITAAIETALAGDYANNVTINLAAGNYTVSKPIVAAGNVIINGNGASIDASTLANPFITLSGTTEYVTLPDNTKDAAHLFIESVILKDLTIKGMPDAIIFDTQKTLLKNLTIDNCDIQVPNKVFINFQSKGYVETVTVKNSTIWSTNNAQFFAQYGSRLKNLNGAEVAGWLQTFDIRNSTFYNIATGKNVCDFQMNSQKCNVYTLKNNIFVNCGKEGQTVVGFNKGGTSPNPIWTVDGNIFNYNGADKSAAETSKAGKKDGENIVKNSIAGVVTFTDAANGDFGGSIDGQVAWGSEAPATVGDPRWTVTLDVTVAPAVPDGDYFVAGLSYDPLMWMNTTEGAASKYGTQITTEYDKTTQTTALKVGEQYLQADLTLGATAFGWTVDEDAVYGHNIYKMDGDKKMYIGTDNATNKLTLIEDATNSSIGWGFFYPDDFYGALALREITGDISGDMTLNEQTGLWEYTAKQVEVTAEKQPAIQVVINGEAQRTYPAEPRVITLADMSETAEAGYYDITITYNDEGNVIAISGTKVEPVAEITKVQISGAPYGVDQWTFVDFTADASQENVYTATLDLSETIENYEFKLVINGGGSDADNWGGWIGTNNVTIDAPEGWGYWTDETEDNKTLWLYNSTTGYKTYTLTATWTPGDNAYKGWTLKIEGKNERIAGDANLDNEVTVSDAVLAVSFVTDKETPTAEQLIAADLDKNNKVEITDVQGIINLALGITEQTSASRASELADNTLSIDGNQLLLQNQTMFTGFQMDVTLENGAELNGVQLSDRAKDMILVYNKVGDNTWRIAAISLSRTAISGNDGCLLTFDVNGNGNVNIKNNIFTDANTQGYNLSLTAPTGISAVKAAMAEGTVVYDMQGRRVENPAKGLYIVNGKKVVLK